MGRCLILVLLAALGCGPSVPEGPLARRITAGMTAAQVIEVAGEPLTEHYIEYRAHPDRLTKRDYRRAGATHSMRRYSDGEVTEQPVAEIPKNIPLDRMRFRDGDSSLIVWFEKGVVVSTQHDDLPEWAKKPEG